MLKVNGFPGLLIAVEGMGGTGKDTQVSFLERRLKFEFPGTNIVTTREPGGTPRGEEIRQKTLIDKNLSAEEEVELFYEARSILYPEVIIPRLKEGAIVLQNRWALASCAYQGAGKGYGVRRAMMRNIDVIKLAPPDVCVFFDVNLDVARTRFSKTEYDKFDLEGPEFWQRTCDGYYEGLKIVREHFPEIQIVVIKDGDGKLEIEQTHRKLWENLEPSIDLWWRIREGLVTHSFATEGAGRPQKERV